MEMKNKTWVVSVALVAACLLCLGGSAAQAQDSKMNLFGGYSFGTNCFGTFSSCTIGDPALHGYALAFAYSLGHHIALEANFSGHNGTPTTEKELPSSTGTGFLDEVSQGIYVYTFGPKFSEPVGNFTLFSHILVGGVHAYSIFKDQCIPATGTGEVGTCSTTAVVTSESVHSNGFAAKVGGGVDWNHHRWGIRILEVDYVHGQLFSTELCPGCQNFSFDSSGNAFELSTGVVFNFGGMK
jgi:hypothetical protein